MASWIWPAVAALVVLDLVITFFVLRRVLARFEHPRVLDFAQLRPLSDAIHERVGQHLRNYPDGHPDQLPALLASLMPELREIALQRGLTADDDTLKAALVVSVSAHGLANPRQVRDALSKVA